MAGLRCRGVGGNPEASAAGQAAAHRSILFCSPLRHALHCRSAHFFGVVCSVHRKAGSKHFGQDDQIRRFIDRVDNPGKLRKVFLRIVPGEFGLNHCHGQS
jgi:hypothetical protein